MGITDNLSYEDFLDMRNQKQQQKLEEELKRLFGGAIDLSGVFLPGITEAGGKGQGFLEYRVGRATKETNAPVKITVDVPGCTKADVTVEIQEAISANTKTSFMTLKVSATRKDIFQTSKLELSVPKLDASLGGYRCDLEKVTAKVENGVLTLIAPLLSPQENKPSVTKVSVL